jgi:mannose-6-phosphate isomerase
MAKIYKLQNQIKHYEWGSLVMLPQFLGVENATKTPYAEMWMGTHSGAPSTAQICGTSVSLKDIAGELPFLFKILGVGSPLSVQAHPNKEQAQEGFAREEEAGLALDVPLRNYKDANHKSEMLCAITPFTLMAGFRQPEEIHKSLEEFLSVVPQLKETIAPLLEPLYTGSLAAFFRNLCLFSDIERKYLSTLIAEVKIEKTDGALSDEQWNLIKNFASQYPGDPAILSPIYLNLVTLQPLQAVHIPNGILHAYVKGFGAEIMSNSDNVLRGGLTSKYVNIPELLNIVDFKAYNAEVFSPVPSLVYRYPFLCDNFSLSIIRSKGDSIELPGNGSVICLVVEGELSVGGAEFKKGESFFIPENTKPLVFSGNYSLFAAAFGV